ncbi:hypothetical protein [Methylophilus sp. 3sh_L]|uniref:hypothetical protein n=1 Tax=Methylophilus sp. 3sh_L TaxID=3377114 RepID=UPI00398F83B1
MTFNIVLGTNIMVAALQNEGSVAREIMRLCLQGQIQPLIGAALFAERVFFKDD